jgi:hypothetical protein
VSYLLVIATGLSSNIQNYDHKDDHTFHYKFPFIWTKEKKICMLWVFDWHYIFHQSLMILIWKKGIAPKSTIETYFDRLGLNLISHQLFLVKYVKQCAGLILNMSFHRLFYILIYYIHASKIFMIIMY